MGEDSKGPGSDLPEPLRSQVYAGGVTWVDQEYNEPTRPRAQPFLLYNLTLQWDATKDKFQADLNWSGGEGHTRCWATTAHEAMNLVVAAFTRESSRLEKAERLLRVAPGGSAL